MSQFPAEIYQTRYFTEQGFVRKRCPGSGAWFWTLDPATIFSGIQDDVQYTFIGKKVFERAWTVGELRARALSWFAAEGHEAMGSYPVLARLWREDLLFTSASICDFQPHVIGRQLLPPANPLVVAQKCIRTNDLENIGRSGRHLSSFTMLGHHAFNFEGEPEIYWIEETTRLCHRFFTEALGADARKITYVEAAWAGGGNAGPCFEVIYEGIEVATLVFMMLREAEGGPYEIKGVHYEEMPTRVVDTGYGVERIVWASQGTPNIYAAVSPGFIKVVSEAAGVDLGGDLVEGYFGIMSGQDIETSGQYDKAQAMIADRLGVSRRALSEAVGPVEAVYGLCDFTRTVLLLLNDQVLPSNKDAGYMTRHLIKRVLGLLESSSVGLSAVEVFGMQFDAMVGDFPELEGKRDTLLDIVAVEVERLAQSMERSRGQLVREIERLVREGATALDEARLFFYYGTLGMPVQEIIDTVRAESDLEVELSDGFPAAYLSRSMGLGQRAEEVALPTDLPATDRLYDEDARAEVADARVTGVHGDWVALDRTILYPEGGGQPGDHGVLTIDGERFEVVDSQIRGGTIFHRLDRGAPSDLVGERVGVELDWGRRHALMRGHSATHLLNAVLRQRLGFHVRQMGAQKGVEASRMDVAHYKPIDGDEIAEIEGRINAAIFAGARIWTEVRSRGAAEAEHGFSIYQGGFVPSDRLRVVHIEGLDAEACAGTHLADVREIGLFKILGVSQIQNNVHRFRYAVGPEALAQHHGVGRLLDALIEVIGAPSEVAVGRVSRLIEENKRQGKLLDECEAALLQIAADAAREDRGGVALHAFRSPVSKDRAMRHVVRMARSGQRQAFFVVFEEGAVFIRSKDRGDLDLQRSVDRFGAFEVQRSAPDMIVFGGAIEAEAAWEIGRQIVWG